MSSHRYLIKNSEGFIMPNELRYGDWLCVMLGKAGVVSAQFVQWVNIKNRQMVVERYNKIENVIEEFVIYEDDCFFLCAEESVTFK